MKLKYPLFVGSVLLSSGGWAQNGPNLVQNPGFEETSEEVTTWDQLDRVNGWSNANAAFTMRYNIFN